MCASGHKVFINCQYTTLFYVGFCLKTHGLNCIVDSLTLNSPPMALTHAWMKLIKIHAFSVRPSTAHLHAGTQHFSSVGAMLTNKSTKCETCSTKSTVKRTLAYNRRVEARSSVTPGLTSGGNVHFWIPIIQIFTICACL